MSLMWMPALITVPPLARGPQRRRHQRADRGEDDRAVELLRRQLLRGAGPLGAELAGELLRLLVARRG